MWGELAAFFVLLSIGFFLSLAQVMGLSLPNPIKVIERLAAFIS
jgi:hypothetical protein